MVGEADDLGCPLHLVRREDALQFLATQPTLEQIASRSLEELKLVLDTYGVAHRGMVRDQCVFAV